MSKEPTEKELKDQLIRAYQRVFLGTQEGQLVFWDIVNQCHLFQPYKEHNASAYAKEGQRALGLYLFSMVQFTPRIGGLPGIEGMKKIHDSIEAAAKLKGTLKDDQ